MAFPTHEHVSFPDILHQMRGPPPFHQVAQCNNVAFIEWAQARGILPRNKVCQHLDNGVPCGLPMYLAPLERENLGFVFRCPGPANDHPYKSLRHGTFFSHSNLHPWKIVAIIYLWSFSDVSQATAQQMLQIGSKTTMVDWHQLCRDLCMTRLAMNPPLIGGPGTIVQIDETQVARAKPARNGRARRVPPRWVIGGICDETREVFMAECPGGRRDAATLLPIIQQHVIAGTTIHSDMWGAYNQLGALGYQHRTVNHHRFFVDPNTGVHTNLAENLWRNAKRKLTRMCGTRPHLLASYYDEFQWRRTVDRVTAFDGALDMIRLQYPQD